MKEALLYEKLDDQRVRCNLCAHRCTIAQATRAYATSRKPGRRPLHPRVRIPLSQAVDPIEKKPLFHFHPGSTAFSIATAAATFAATFARTRTSRRCPASGADRCQQTAPEEVVRAAQRSGSRSIAYTYTEPTISFEYSYDIARLASAVGIASVYVTNGYMTRRCSTCSKERPASTGRGSTPPTST